MALKAIPTTYANTTFRSRLEARWAVYFDALGIAWEYEHQGYELPDGTWYLPDFWLPTFSGGMFVEVKPVGGDFAKARLLAGAEDGVYVWLAEGTPDLALQTVAGSYNGIAYEDDEAIPLYCSAHDEDRMFWCAGFDPDDDICGWPEHISDAVLAARSARF